MSTMLAQSPSRPYPRKKGAWSTMSASSCRAGQLAREWPPVGSQLAGHEFPAFQECFDERIFQIWLSQDGGIYQVFLCKYSPARRRHKKDRRTLADIV